MRTILMAWIGRTDLRAPKESDVVGLGPIAQALDTGDYAEVWLLANYPKEEVAPYVKWLERRGSMRVEVLREDLSGPTNFGEIYEAAIRSVDKALDSDAGEAKLTFHLSPGTPAMSAVWILLGKTRFSATFIESSREHGVRDASVPFDISVDFLKGVFAAKDERLRDAAAAKAPIDSSFEDILHRSAVMSRLIEKAGHVAVRSVPVLIEGESGTGKELFARAIHRASPRRDRSFIPVNCGAIPPELVESQLFGHERGAFTGADQARRGFFEEASGGTIFLDEVGELPAAVQVKMLRVLQEQEVMRVGATTPIAVDVRIIAATNRVLVEEIAAGHFREDLFYRLAVAVLHLPALRDRSGCLGLLMEDLLKQANRAAAEDPGHEDKKLSAGAKNVFMGHAWPGNVRELLNTLTRAIIWSEGKTISAQDARDALLARVSTQDQGVLGQALGSCFNLQQTMDEVARHYLERAMKEAACNKSKAAELLGLSSYQTLSNWLEKYKVKA
jgi:transcriptional regulator with PAS, ATPase and Fis domain